MWLRAGCFDLERTRKEDVEQGGGTNPDSLSDFTKRSGRRQVRRRRVGDDGVTFLVFLYRSWEAVWWCGAVCVFLL